ncbi:MAG: cytochrome ubiquinol oxidase subunit I [Thermoanaerobaculales bacterium]|jgi:mono/diheme cytochrome c family protein|nr:cytochrome ubiquinol oxidase subunit I [Thermoanaerobaculales bacterium]
MDYPIWDVALGGGMLMALVAIPHVIVAHFAIGGGLLIAVTETLAVRRSDFELRELARRSSLVLILVSTVFGAISGVGIWVVAGLISPAAISALIHTYVWGWAMEWVFFILEIVAALVYYATWGRISKQAHLLVGWLYVVGAYLSLVVINGIITFMLTPGEWLASRAFWDGFFNPTYWPSLVLRTGIALLMATAFMIFVALRAGVERREALLRYLGWWLVAGCVVAYAGYRWWEAVLPGTVRNLFRGAEPALAQLAATRSFALWSLTAALLLGLVVLVLAPRLARPATAAVLALAAFAFFGGYERLREGVRKPFLIHSHLFSNGLLLSAIPELNESGVAAHSGWVARGGEDGASLGRALFRAQCASCHTLDGYQSIRRALPSRADLAALAAAEGPEAAERAFRAECAACHAEVGAQEMQGMLPSAEEMGQDPEMMAELNRGMIAATLLELRDMGEAFTAAPHGAMVDTAPLFAPYMPPFVGTDRELEALADHLASLDRGAEPTPARQGGL